MKEFVVVGRPNSGKTLFTLNFAGYLGCKTVDITFRAVDGYLNCRHLSLPEAKKELCDPQCHKTRSIQSLQLKVPVGKSTVAFKLSDCCGITEQIHPDEKIRQGMAQTLSLLRCSDYIFHIIDLTTVTDDNNNCQNNIDHEIYQYGVSRNRYILLANKTDLVPGKSALTKLADRFSEATVIPISALYSQGFPLVKACVARNV